MRAALAAIENLDIYAAPAGDIEIVDGRLVAVITEAGERIACAVAGADHRHISERAYPYRRHSPSPRAGSGKARHWRWPKPCMGLICAMGRLKTGTPPRLNGKTIDWSGLEEQPGDDTTHAPFRF